MRYEIVEGQSRVSMNHTSRNWTVVAYEDDGTCRGGDAHWVRREFAEAAKAMYEAGAEHGRLRGDAVVGYAKGNGWDGR